MKQAVFALLLLAAAAGQPARNTWPAEYARRDAAAFAAEFEEPSRALFRYRAAMAGLMQVKPGMKVGEVGAGSGAFARYLAEKVGPQGHVYANELEAKMVAYMKDRAEKEGLGNFTAVAGTPASTGFEPESLDAVGVVYAYSFFDQPAAMLQSINESMKPGAVLLIVDIPSEQVGQTTVGYDAEEVVAHAARAGFSRVAENGVVPGHYSLIFRKGPPPGDVAQGFSPASPDDVAQGVSAPSADDVAQGFNPASADGVAQGFSPASGAPENKEEQTWS